MDYLDFQQEFLYYMNSQLLEMSPFYFLFFGRGMIQKLYYPQWKSLIFCTRAYENPMLFLLGFL